MSNDARRRFRAIVHGRVQGVGFRWATKDRAEELTLAGFARNLDDGCVEVEAEGDAERVEALRRWLEHGPRWARVDAVDTTEVPVTGEREFRIIT